MEKRISLSFLPSCIKIRKHRTNEGVREMKDNCRKHYRKKTTHKRKKYFLFRSSNPILLQIWMSERGERERERNTEREQYFTPHSLSSFLTEPFFMESWKRTLDKYRLGDTERQQRTIFLGIQRSNICYHSIEIQ